VKARWNVNLFVAFGITIAKWQGMREDQNDAAKLT
jgi:hypothetical protein